MTDRDCSRFKQQLVDYSDGALSPGDSDRVAEHIAACPECRRALHRLERSLEIARSIWEEYASDTRPVLPTRDRRWRSVRLLSAAVLSVSAVALVSIGVYLWFGGLRGRPAPIAANGDTPTETVEHDLIDNAGDIRPAEHDVVALIARDARRAKLMASAQLLAGEPVLRDYKEKAERYLAEAYSDANSADTRNE